MEMDMNVYLRLSAMMFMEFAVWGAWMPVLAIRLRSDAEIDPTSCRTGCAGQNKLEEK